MSSSAVVPFQPHRFRSAASHYVRGRLDYPAQLIEQVVALTKLERGHSVLDLGCGPGFLAVAFAPHAGHMIGIDPEPAMLDEAQTYARDKGATVTFQQGSSYDLTPSLGSFHLVTMGRSFQWMDRKATLEALDLLIEPGGAIAFFHDSHPHNLQNAWQERFRSVLEPYSKNDAGHFLGGGRNGSWSSHEPYLLNSKFNRLHRLSVVAQIRTSVERLVDRALSMSSTSPEKLGAELDAVVGRLHRTLAADAQDGAITEIVQSEAIVAFRSET